MQDRIERASPDASPDDTESDHSDVNDAEFAGLVCARICHDLTGPINGMGAGAELLVMEAAERTPELALLEDSVGAAVSALKFMRAAFGPAGGADERTGLRDLRALADPYFADKPASLVWEAGDGDLPHDAGRLLLLMILCAGAACRGRGQIQVRAAGGGAAALLEITASSGRPQVEARARALFETGAAPERPQPADAAFLAAHRVAQARGMALSILVATEGEITFRAASGAADQTSERPAA